MKHKIDWKKVVVLLFILWYAGLFGLIDLRHEFWLRFIRSALLFGVGMCAGWVWALMMKNETE